MYLDQAEIVRDKNPRHASIHVEWFQKPYKLNSIHALMKQHELYSDFPKLQPTQINDRSDQYTYL